MLLLLLQVRRERLQDIAATARGRGANCFGVASAETDDDDDGGAAQAICEFDKQSREDLG